MLKLIVLVAFTASFAQAQQCPDNDADYKGGDLKLNLDVPSWWECGKGCQKEAECTGFTYVQKTKCCYLKSGDAKSNRVAAPGLISGDKTCPAPYECYSWSKKDTAAKAKQQLKGRAGEKKYCEGVLGHKWSRGNNKLAPGCGSCWCCQSTTAGTKPAPVKPAPVVKGFPITFIKGFKYTVVKGGYWLFRVQYLLKKNYRIGLIGKLGKVYTVSFGLYPVSFKKGWNNILHFTIHGDYTKYGSRAPGVWFYGNQFYVMNAISGNKNLSWKTTAVPLKKWSTIVISQNLEGGKYIYRIIINRKVMYTVRNTKPAVFSKVHVYASDPWYAQAHAWIRNLRVLSYATKPVPTATAPVIKGFPITFIKGFKYVINQGGYWLFRIQFLIKRNYRIATIAKLGKTFTVKFQIYPLSFPAGWRSILHMTINGDYAVYGSRMPGIWFYGNQFHVMGAISGNKNFNWKGGLALKKWSTIEIGQGLQGGKYWFRIFINGKLMKQVVNTRVAIFSKMHIYVSDPWYAAAHAYIRNLRILASFRKLVPVKVALAPGFAIYFIKGLKYSVVKGGYWLFRIQFLIRKNYRIATITKLGKVFTVLFDIYPLSFPAGWRSILHMTINGDYAVYGSRMPGIWFYGNQFHVMGAISGNKNFNWKGGLALKKWSKIEIAQCLQEGKYWFRIFINGKLMKQVVNTRVAVFSKMHIYVSDPWYAAAHAYIKNLKILAMARKLVKKVTVVKKPATKPAPKPAACSVQTRHIGCFKDSGKRAIGGAYQVFPAATVVKQCAAKAAKLGHQIMAVQYNVYCFTDKASTIKNRKSTYARYGRTTGCVNGRGGGMKNDVYQVKCMKPGKTMGGKKKLMKRVRVVKKVRKGDEEVEDEDEDEDEDYEEEH